MPKPRIKKVAVDVIANSVIRLRAETEAFKQGINRATHSNNLEEIVKTLELIVGNS